MIVMIIPRKPCLTCTALRVTEWLVDGLLKTHIYTYHSRKKTIIINYTEKLTGI